ncbi:MAG: FMN-binding protein [Candidatus Omnitrophica bacterium]|nr:FMN-binding protein [Candidatus Omnitrophota bacterium]
MKKQYPILSFIILLCFLASSFLYHGIQAADQASEGTLSKNVDIAQAGQQKQIREIFPQAHSIHINRKDRIHYIIYDKQSMFLGIAFYTKDIAPDIYGYGGHVNLLVGITAQGTLTSIKLINHLETPAYVEGKLLPFLQQFSGRSIQDKIVLDQNVNAITHATVSSTAVVNALNQSIAKMSTLRVVQEKLIPPRSSFPAKDIILTLLLFMLAIISVLTSQPILRWFTLLSSLLYLGILKGSMISASNIAVLFSGRWPLFQTNPHWYLLTFFSILCAPYFGMVFCGYLCPFAGTQEILHALTKKIRKQRTDTISPAIENKARFIKYAVLMIAVSAGILTGHPNIAIIEPFITLFTFNGSHAAWILLGLMLLLSMIYYRFWCRFFCPVGAFLGLIAQKSLWGITLKKYPCSYCLKCEQICPTRAINFQNKDHLRVDTPECVLCLECVNNCPDRTLGVRRYGKK